ncbi:MAG TPA: DoxX family protein [Azospirillaceae bacterium]|nr:DoxX family protein [Azospirillaceae bacterium]
MEPNRFLPYTAFVMRVAMGAMLLGHGFYYKIMLAGPDKVVPYFESIGYPGFFAYLVIFGEVAGGVALILGVFTRLVCLLLLPIMLGATWQHIDNGWLFTAKGGGWEFPSFWITALLVQASIGDGAFGLSRRAAALLPAPSLAASPLLR